MRLSCLISMTNFKKALSLASRLVIQFQASDFPPQRGSAHAQFGRRFRRIGALPQHLLDRLLLDLGHLVEPAGTAVAKVTVVPAPLWSANFTPTLKALNGCAIAASTRA